MTAPALWPMGEVSVHVSATLIFDLALVMGGIGTGYIQLRFRGRSIARRCQWWGVVMICRTF